MWSRRVSTFAGLPKNILSILIVENIHKGEIIEVRIPNRNFKSFKDFSLLYWIILFKYIH
jgi:hypothetical protein